MITTTIRKQSETADLHQRHVVRQVAAPYSVWQRFLLCPISVFFNRGSVEPKGSASICQGFCGWSVKKLKNNLACEITSNQAIKVTVAPYAPIMLSFRLAPLTVYFSMQCWIFFLLLTMLEYLHWTSNTNLLVSVLRNRVFIYWKTFISWNTLLEKYTKLHPSAHGWQSRPLSCPWA